MKQFKRVALLATVTFFVLTGTAFANPSQASATCEGGIVYSGHDYPSSGNTVTVKIDGKIVAGFPKTFGSQTSGTVVFPDKTHDYSWEVVWDRYNGTDGDRTQEGRVHACVVEETTTTTVPPTTTTIPATTTTVPDVTTTVVDETTTTVAAVDIPTTTQPLPTVPVEPLAVVSDNNTALPRTGGSTTILAIAAVMVAAGVLMLLTRIRPARK